MLELNGAAAAFDRRLDPHAPQPLAVACSGGGDSVAALLAAKAWADVHSRRVVVLHVDHGLQSSSGAWAAFVADLAARLGCEFRSLAWRGDKPAVGLAAAARRARHGLLAEAARATGARVIVLGHTWDDALEADLMRAEGSTLGRLLAWSPSPVWPQGRGVFLLRPLMASRRAEIRRALTAAGELWIDDPANADLRSPRARARRRLGEEAAAPAVPDLHDQGEATLAAAAQIDPCGMIRIGRELLRAASPAAGRRFLGAAALCAGGGERPPRRARVEALLERLLADGTFVATLAGARILAADTVQFVRDAGEVARGGLTPVAVQSGAPVVWDGRFALRIAEGRADVAALKGRAAALDRIQREALKEVAAAARASLPAVRTPSASLTCPILAGDRAVTARFLGGERLLAACGAISKEPTS